MADNLLLVEKLEHTLQTKWTEFIDYRQLLAIVREHVLNTQFKQIVQAENSPKPGKLSVTQFKIVESGFEITAEYTAMKDDGVVVGTLILHLNRAGGHSITESYGTQISPVR